MAGFCKKCGCAFDRGSLCAHCGSPVGLDAQASTYTVSPSAISDSPDGPSFLRRLFLGVVAIIGIYFGLVHMTLGLTISASGVTSMAVEASLGLLIAATLAGSTAAGTVNRTAEFTGLLLGVAAAGGFFAMETHDGRLPLDEGWLAVGTALAVVGIVGGVAGRIMVPPAPKLPTLGQIDGRKLQTVYKPRVPIIWWRVVLGVILVTLGVVYADSIRLVLAKAFAGHSALGSLGRMISWQVSLIAGVVGGMVCGANSRSGIKQGFIGGSIAAFGAVIALVRTSSAPSLVLEYWYDLLGVSEVGPELFAAAGGATWLTVIIGGWLGGQLFPPRRRRTI